MNFSKFKAMLIYFKADILNGGTLSPEEAIQIEYLAFRSVDEPTIYESLKSNWVEYNWLVKCFVTITSGLYILVKLLSTIDLIGRL